MALELKRSKASSSRKGDVLASAVDIDANARIFPELPPGLPDLHALLTNNVYIHSFERDALYALNERCSFADATGSYTDAHSCEGEYEMYAQPSDIRRITNQPCDTFKDLTSDLSCYIELSDRRFLTQRQKAVDAFNVVSGRQLLYFEQPCFINYQSRDFHVTGAVVATHAKLFPHHDMLVRDAEQGVVKELCCEAIVRNIVSEAADLYAARCLDCVKEGYTACSVWAEVRDNVAAAFLPVDVGCVSQNYSFDVLVARGAIIPTARAVVHVEDDHEIARSTVAQHKTTRDESRSSAAVRATCPLSCMPSACYDLGLLSTKHPCTLLMSASHQLRVGEEEDAEHLTDFTFSEPSCRFASFAVETSSACSVLPCANTARRMTAASMELTPGASPARVPVDDYCRYLVRARQHCELGQSEEECCIRRPKMTKKVPVQRTLPHGATPAASPGSALSQCNGASSSALDSRGTAVQRAETAVMTTTTKSARPEKGNTQRLSTGRRSMNRRSLAARVHSPCDVAGTTDTPTVAILKPTTRERAARLVMNDDLTSALVQVPPSHLSTGVVSGSANNAAHALTSGRVGVSTVTLLQAPNSLASGGEVPGVGTQPVLSRTPSTTSGAIAQRRELVYNSRRDVEAKGGCPSIGVVGIVDSQVVPQRSARLERARAMQRQSTSSGRHTITDISAAEGTPGGLTFRVQHSGDADDTAGGNSLAVSEEQVSERIPHTAQNAVPIRDSTSEKRGARSRTGERRDVISGRTGAAPRRPYAERRAKVDESPPQVGQPLFVLPLPHTSETETLAKQLHLQPKPGVVLQQSTAANNTGATTDQRPTSDFVRPAPRGRRDERAVVADGGAFVVPTDKQRWVEYSPVTEAAVRLTIPSVAQGHTSAAVADRQGPRGSAQKLVLQQGSHDGVLPRLRSSPT